MLPDFLKSKLNKNKTKQRKTRKQNKTSKGEIIRQKSNGFDHSAHSLKFHDRISLLRLGNQG